jgi:immune inhibitor A
MFTIIFSFLISMPPNPFARTAIHEPKMPKLMDAGMNILPKPIGEKKALILLVDFSDNPQTYQPTDFDSLIYGTNQATMRDYYSEVSYGKFTISRSSKVVGWLRAPHNYSYYIGDSFGFYPGNYPYSVQGLVMDACNLADDSVNFADFDENGDGVVDAIFIVHAGPGAEETGAKNMIWSHQWQLSNTGTGCPGPYQSADGVVVDFYSMEPERLVTPAVRITCGVFVHEFGHQLGLPDLYDRDYSTNGLGLFCLMAAGSWGQAATSDPPGSSPAHLCAWAKYQLGWVTPTALERAGVHKLENQSIANTETNPVSYRLLEDPGGPDWGESGGQGGEYFLTENRTRIGFDKSLPGEGLLILHCDDDQTHNDNENHPLVGIMQGDGGSGFLIPPGSWGEAADLWKDNAYGFGDTSQPNSFYYEKSGARNPSGVWIYNIGAAGSSQTASLWVTPVLLGQVYAYPNPFRSDRLPTWGRKAIITYIPTDTSGLADPYPAFRVIIYNLAGEQVRIIDQPADIDRYNRRAYWDLKNGKGDEVVSGMYIFILETQGAKVERNKGRITIIR